MTTSASQSSRLKRSKVHLHTLSGTTLLDVRRAIKTLKDGMIQAEVPQLQMSCAEIVVTELLNNIVKHAQQDIQNGWFDLQCTRQERILSFVCRDNGAVMPGGAPPQKVIPALSHNHLELPEGGWGWALIHTLTTDLTYTRLDGINCVSFNIPLTGTRKH